MKAIAIALCSLATVAAPAAFAQDNSDRNYPFDPYRVERQQQRDAWRYERDRGYYRDGRFYGDDRFYGERFDDRYRDERVFAWRDFARRGNVECWNPRARHYESVREGDFQDDLDYNRCRALRYGWR